LAKLNKKIKKQKKTKTVEISYHWIVTGWHGEQLDFQNNGKTMEHVFQSLNRD
jgi:hypothetical protein